MNNEKKYMVFYVDVDNGEVSGVYEADKLGEITSGAKAFGKKKVPVPPLSAVSQVDSIATVYWHTSPGCRAYFWGGEWVVVCK